MKKNQKSHEKVDGINRRWSGRGRRSGRWKKSGRWKRCGRWKKEEGEKWEKRFYSLGKGKQNTKLTFLLWVNAS